MTERDDQAAALQRELARLRRQTMFGLLTEQDQARRATIGPARSGKGRET